MEENNNPATISGNSVDISLGQAAIIAGIALIIMTVLGPIASFSVLQGLVVPGNADRTVENIIASENLFRIGILCFLTVAVLDVIVAWALYVFFSPVNKPLSLLAAWFRIVYAAVLGAVLFNLTDVLRLLNGDGYVSVFGFRQIHAQVLLSLHAFSDGWQLG